jgi:DNA-binding GntR family transcriptional regulator
MQDEQIAETETRAEALHRQLEHEILQGLLPPGMRLDEQDMAGRFGVSRTPVREAFRLLAASGLVELRSRQGAVVTRVGIAELLEMFQVMAELEGLCARLAARRITPAARAALQVIHGRLIEAASGSEAETFYQINREFHEALYEAAQNGFLAKQTRALRNRVAAYRRQVTYLPGRIRGTLQEHGAVLAALDAQDPDAAHAAMRDHVNLLGDVLADFIATFD